MTVLRRAAVTCLVYASVALCSAGMFQLVKVRAVEAPSVCSDLADAEAQIQLYLSSSSSSSAASGVFHVQGWRWHTMSLVLEARRLHQLAVRVLEQQQQQDDLSDLTALQTVADYTVNFNLRGLHRIEKDLFFPWVRTKTKTIREKDVVRAFDDVLDQLERDRQRIETLGALLVCHDSLFNSNRLIFHCISQTSNRFSLIHRRYRWSG